MCMPGFQKMDPIAQKINKVDPIQKKVSQVDPVQKWANKDTSTPMPAQATPQQSIMKKSPVYKQNKKRTIMSPVDDGTPSLLGG